MAFAPGPALWISGEARVAEVRAGEVRAGEERAKEVRIGEVRAVEVRAAEVRALTVREARRRRLHLIRPLAVADGCGLLPGEGNRCRNSKANCCKGGEDSGAHGESPEPRCA